MVGRLYTILVVLEVSLSVCGASQCTPHESQGLTLIDVFEPAKIVGRRYPVRSVADCNELCCSFDHGEDTQCDTAVYQPLSTIADAAADGECLLLQCSPFENCFWGPSTTNASVSRIEHEPSTVWSTNDAQTVDDEKTEVSSEDEGAGTSQAQEQSEDDTSQAQELSEDDSYSRPESYDSDEEGGGPQTQDLSEDESDGISEPDDSEDGLSSQFLVEGDEDDNWNGDEFSWDDEETAETVPATEAVAVELQPSDSDVLGDGVQSPTASTETWLQSEQVEEQEPFHVVDDVAYDTDPAIIAPTATWNTPESTPATATIQTNNIVWDSQQPDSNVAEEREDDVPEDGNGDDDAAYDSRYRESQPSETPSYPLESSSDFETVVVAVQEEQGGTSLNDPVVLLVFLCVLLFLAVGVLFFCRKVVVSRALSSRRYTPLKNADVTSDFPGMERGLPPDYRDQTVFLLPK